MDRDYILKISYSKCVGWRVKVHRNGCDIPIIDIINDDRDTACDTAYCALKTIIK